MCVPGSERVVRELGFQGEAEWVEQIGDRGQRAVPFALAAGLAHPRRPCGRHVPFWSAAAQSDLERYILNLDLT